MLVKCFVFSRVGKISFCSFLGMNIINLISK